MPTETRPVLEVMVIEADTGADPLISLEVTLASLKAAQAAGHSLSVTLGFSPDASAETALGGLDIRLEPDLTASAAEGHLSLGRLAKERFYVVMSRGHAFPWTVKPHELFQQGRAAFFGMSGGEDAIHRVRAALVSGVAVPTAVLPPASIAIYSAALAERAVIMLQSMYGSEHRSWTGALASEPALYALMNDDRMHADHFLVERNASPLGNIAKPFTELDRPYARLTGV